MRRLLKAIKQLPVASYKVPVSEISSGAVQLIELAPYLFAQTGQFLRAPAQSLDHLLRGFRQELLIAQLPLPVGNLFFNLLQLFLQALALSRNVDLSLVNDVNIKARGAARTCLF